MKKILKTTTFMALAIAVMLGAAAISRAADFNVGSIAAGIANDATSEARKQVKEALKGDTKKQDVKKDEAKTDAAKPAKPAKTRRAPRGGDAIVE